MNYKYSLRFLLITLACFALPLSGQQISVWPGDTDNNGRVNGADMLFWAYAYGERGKFRPDATIIWTGQDMPQAWESSFPEGLDFAYADGDGDGKISQRDLTPLFNNQHRTRVSATPNSYFEMPDTTGNHEVVLSLEPAGVSLTEDGMLLMLDVNLTGRDSAFTNFHGITFKATFSPGAFANWESRILQTGGLIADLGGNDVVWATVDSLSGTLSVTITEIDHSGHRVNGTIQRLSIPLAEGFSLEGLTDSTITIDSILVHDQFMRSIPAATDTLTFSEQISCSFSVDPVCGNDGITYLNSCFAEAAGVTVYTTGPCWSPGLDHTAMNPDASCPTNYDPVCGFNGVTYTNACAAEAAGVLNYSPGVCNPGDLSCYDPSLIVISNGTSVNMVSGVISLLCPAGASPVCGCDGEQYSSPCQAEASGVRSYVTGSCSDGCIDVAQIADNSDCGTETAFVCGCNDETYINACYAESAGVVDYTFGPCNGVSNWCEEATVISCGDYLPNETTVGAGNQLTSYPGATSVLMQGTDRVYVFEKTSAGDLQIGLEIITPGLNMDLFLLTGDCNNYQVVGSSTYSNNQTNNEGIVLEDAPNGTYYIVVDAPFAGPGGDYRLELSCGYLDCSDRVPLSCSTPYNGTNAGGTDDVSTYTCGNTLNVENNGPEIVHSFTITESGPVTIDLTNMSANLELFLLNECSRRSCLEFSQNPGATPESITRTLPAGTYYVVVDGYNGAISDYTLTVDCSASCEMDMQVISQTNTGCGQMEGSITFQVTGGSPTFTYHYVGPVCRTGISTSGVFTYSDLPPGDYTSYIEDSNGCEMAFNFTITSDGGSMEATVTTTAAGCGQQGGIGIAMTTVGTTPYTIYLSGATNATLTTSANNFQLSPLAAGNYTILIVDANGCSTSESVVIENSDGGMDVTITPVPVSCDGTAGRIHIQAPDGTLPYSVQLSGPISGGATVNSYDFHINDLVAGQYSVTLTDAFGCTVQQDVTVGIGGDMDVQVSSTPANCGVPGAALVTIASGTPPYMINYAGPVTGSETTNDQTTIINGLLAGTYSFSIWDANGCDQSETVFVADNGGNLDFAITQMFAACDGNDSGLLLIINGGTPNYTVEYTGTVDGSMTVGGSGTATLELPAGTYSFTATDFSGCSSTQEVTVNSGISSAFQQSFSYGAGCGQIDNIRTLLNGGEGPFEVTVTTDACPEENQTFTTNDIEFELTDLPNCTYTISVIDGGGCQSQQTVTINVDPNTGLLNLSPLDGACGGTGAIRLDIDAGESPFFINWTGPVSGSVNLAAYEYIVSDLPAGTYTFFLTNNDGCEDTQSITLNNDGSLEVISSIVTDDCGVPDQIWNDIEGGQGPYTVEVIRNCDGEELPVEVVLDQNGFEIVDIVPCCYEITVTDANGCTTTTEVCVDPYNLFNLIPEDGICGQPGSVEVMVMNSNAVGPYTINYTGPVSGVITDEDGQVIIPGLPAGTYTFTVSDVNGCTETEEVTIEDIPSDLTLATALINNDCGQYNQLWNDVTGGVLPYTVVVTRLCDGQVDTTFTQETSGFELTDLDECCYEVKVTDALGCMVTTESCVEDENPDIFSINPVPGPCGQNGRIDLSFDRGTAPYTVTYTGPQSGDNNTVSGNALSINDTPPGDYTFTVTDANGCTETESTTLDATTNDLVLQAALISNECGQYNQVWIDIFNGTGPFSIEVIRLCDNTTLTEFVSGEVGFELMDLPPCDYKIIVTDQAGCMVMDVITVFPAPINIFDLETMSGECNDPSSFNLQITSVRAPYTIEYNGPVSDSFVTFDTEVNLSGLPSGDYTLFVTDSVGCIETEQFTFSNTTTDLDLVTSLIFNDCNQLNQLWNDINGGIAPFTVDLIRLCDGTIDTTFTTSETQFELTGLTACEYKVKVTDATGCMDMETIDVASSTADLVDIEINNSCDSSGFHLTFIGGNGPYRIVIAGPITEQFIDIDTPTFYIPAPSGDYMLRVFSADGCDEMSFMGVVASGEGIPPVAAFTTQGSDLAVTFLNQSVDALTYAWDFGDGTTSTEEAPDHIYTQAGTYNICLTVTNDCGADETCEVLTLTEGGNVQIIIGGANSSPGNSVRIPVSIQGAQNIATMAGTFAIDDPGLATITHVSEGAILPQFNPDNNSFTYVSNGSEGLELTESINVLFFIHLDLGNVEGVTDINFANSPLSLELSAVRNGIPVLVDAGYLPGFVGVSTNLLGMVSSMAYDMDDEEIDLVNFQLTEPDENYTLDLEENSDGIPTTLTGLTLGRMYNITPTKSADPVNGLSSFEIFLGQRYLLGNEVPQITDPMQVVGLDMNCSESFSIIDLFIMQSLLVGDLENVPNCNSWTFVPESHTFPEDFSHTNIFPVPRMAEVMLQGDSMVMFSGVKTGDLLGDADPGRSAGSLPLTVKLLEMNAGEVVNLQLTLVDAHDLVAFQGELLLAEGLEFVSATGLTLGNLAVGDYLAERGRVFLSWFSSTGDALGADAGAQMVEVAVRVTDTYVAGTQPFAFDYTSSFETAAHGSQGERYLPEINLLSPINDAHAFRLHGAVPNPASEYTDLAFDLPVAGEVELTVLDGLGRPVIRRAQALGAGANRFRLDTRALPAGTYYYHLTTGEHTGTGKVVVKK
jgi:hypothetical protein